MLLTAKVELLKNETKVQRGSSILVDLSKRQIVRQGHAKQLEPCNCTVLYNVPGTVYNVHRQCILVH